MIPTQQPTTSDLTQGTHGALIAAGKVSGSDVYGADAKRIGSIDDLMIDKHAGTVEYAVLNFGGFFGWANLTLFNSGGYLGMTKGPGPTEMRVVDLYRIQDGKLAENWIFIDILHYLAVQGLDVLGRMTRIREYQPGN